MENYMVKGAHYSLFPVILHMMKSYLVTPRITTKSLPGSSGYCSDRGKAQNTHNASNLLSDSSRPNPYPSFLEPKTEPMGSSEHIGKLNVKNHKAGWKRVVARIHCGNIVEGSQHWW